MRLSRKRLLAGWNRLAAIGHNELTHCVDCADMELVTIIWGALERIVDAASNPPLPRLRSSYGFDTIVSSRPRRNLQECRMIPIREILTVALTLGASVGWVKTTVAQPAKRGHFDVSLGAALPTNLGGFSDAYNLLNSAAFGLGIAVTDAMVIRTYFEGHTFSYDRVRFFEGLGLSGVDLDEQLGGGVILLRIGVGGRLNLLSDARIRPFVSVGVAYVSRQSNAERLAELYCLNPTGVDPEGCSRALAETRIDDTGVSADAGFGLEGAVTENLAAFVEIAYIHSFLSPKSGVFPFRAGAALRF